MPHATTNKIKALTNSENILTGSLADYRDMMVKVMVGTDDVDLGHPTDFVLPTLEEAYADMEVQSPDQGPSTPEEEAIGLYNLAVEPYQQGDYETAERLAKDALGKDPRQVDALKLLVYANRKTKDWLEVLEFSEKFLEFHPEDKSIREAALHAAEMTHNTARIAELKIDPRDKTAPGDLFADAVDLIVANDDVGARKLLEQVLEQDPRYSRAHFEMAKIHVREYEFENAIKSLESYLKYADPDDRDRKEASDLILTLSE